MPKTRLLHHTKAPLTTIHSVEQRETHRSFVEKPRGLWVSVDEPSNEGLGWAEWCQGEGFGLDGFQHNYEIKLAPDSNILRISTPEGLDDFTAEYGFEGLAGWDQAIDWAKVARDHQGIIIAPYIRPRRLSLMWYYGWDCASGCIWDAAAIESFTEIEFRLNDQGEEEEVNG